MDEYIKREDAMKALDEYRLSHTMSMHGDMELLMEFRDGVVGAMNALAFVPAADVVPKSEVDKWFSRCGDWYEVAELKQQRIAELEAEVVKALNEVELLIIITKEMYKQQMKDDPNELSKQSKRTKWVAFEKFYEQFAELKKKYDKDCRDCRCFVGCETACGGRPCDGFEAKKEV